MATAPRHESTRSALVGYGTSLRELITMGAVAGLVVGLAQALVLAPQARMRWVWAACQPVLWAAGWAVTTLAGIDVEHQYVVFGASGALVFTALSGLVLERTVTRAPRPLPARGIRP